MAYRTTTKKTKDKKIFKNTAQCGKTGDSSIPLNGKGKIRQSGNGLYFKRYSTAYQSGGEESRGDGPQGNGRLKNAGSTFARMNEI